MSDIHDDPEFLDDDDFVSKTQLKQEMHKLQALGQRLMKLNPAQQAQLPLSDKLKDALETDRRITSHNAKKRHLQFVGRVMRRENIDAIQAYLDRLDSSSEAFNQRFHQLEVWRNRLLEEGNEALTEYLNQNPEAEIQQLRQMIRKAKKEISESKAPATSRKLFRYLRKIEEQQALEALEEAQLPLSEGEENAPAE